MHVIKFIRGQKLRCANYYEEITENKGITEIKCKVNSISIEGTDENKDIEMIAIPMSSILYSILDEANNGEGSISKILKLFTTNNKTISISISIEEAPNEENSWEIFWNWLWAISIKAKGSIHEKDKTFTVDGGFLG